MEIMIIKRIKNFIKKHLIFLRDFRRFRNNGGVVENVVKVNISYTQFGQRFVGHNVLVSGGSSGIGLAIAKAFLAEGAKVIITGRNKDKLEKTASELNSSNLYMMQWDISETQLIEHKLEEMSAILPPPCSKIDIFINSAGVAIYHPVDRMQENIYDNIVSINQKGLFFMNHAEGLYLIKHKIEGRIINITSAAGKAKNLEPYTVFKWGANSITQSTARWLSPYRIAVNAISPGETPTNISARLEAHIDNENKYTHRHRTQRFTFPEEIAECALFLASGAAGNVIGNIIDIDGDIYE